MTWETWRMMTRPYWLCLKSASPVTFCLWTMSMHVIVQKVRDCLYCQKSNARSFSWDWSDRSSWPMNTDLICHLSPYNIVYLMTSGLIFFIDQDLPLVPAETLAWHWFSNPRCSLFITQCMSSGHVQVTMVAQHFWSVYSLGCKVLILLWIKTPTDIAVAETRARI